MKSIHKKAFTLVELLVVISIIGVLSSTVFATLSSAKSKANDAVRYSKLNQIQKALLLYYEKYGVYPYSSGALAGQQSTENGRSNSCANFIAATIGCGGGGEGSCLEAWGTWDSVMNLLIAEGFLPSIPKDPKNTGYTTHFSSCFKYAAYVNDSPNWSRCGATSATNEIQMNNYHYVLLFSSESHNLNLPRFWWNGLGVRPYEYCILGPAR
jgi:prepilin-type N-terminal cleavage/methylation domain-containing protein